VERQADEARDRLLAIGEIAAEVAHELRNTLQVITANVYLARQNPAASGPVLLKIERSARLAHSIVDDLMSLAPGEAAHAESILLAEALVAARMEIAPEAATWEDAMSPVDLRVRAHTGLVSRLLHALYENAILASAPRAPTISTRACVDGDAVLVEVADDGPGVSPEIAARIFDPLVTGRSGGSGLGLALARRIVAAHGGSIVLADSQAGACFRIRIPIEA
jgi:two-component system C4-dicarboxylate transport sensor histidine kinase DctB